MKAKLTFRTLTLALFTFFLSYSNLQSQFEKKGVRLKSSLNSSKGDTIYLYGRRVNTAIHAYQYLIMEPEYKYINVNKIKLVEGHYVFWEDIWFNNRAADLRKNGWEYESRVKEDAIEFYNQLLQNNLIYYDDFFSDYLYHLINKMHPTKLIKKKPTNFAVVVMKSSEEKYFVFDNGLIVLTTGIIAKTKSEKDLVLN